MDPAILSIRLHTVCPKQLADERFHHDCISNKVLWRSTIGNAWAIMLWKVLSFVLVCNEVRRDLWCWELLYFDNCH